MTDILYYNGGKKIIFSYLFKYLGSMIKVGHIILSIKADQKKKSQRQCLFSPTFILINKACTQMLFGLYTSLGSIIVE